jgi:hypothetical protein
MPDGAEHVGVIRECHRAHSAAPHLLCQLTHFDHTSQERILRVNVQMDELGHDQPFLPRAARSSVALLVALAISSCGETENSDRASDAGMEGGAGASGSRVPPQDPGMPLATGTAPTVLAINHLFLGDTDRDGTETPDAWADFGYDLDGLASSPEDAAHCAPPPGSSPAIVQTDGNDGVDNSFGRNLLPVLRSFSPSASQLVNESIGGGEFTILFELRNLGPEPTQSGVVTALHSGLELPLDARPPRFDGSDVWPLSPELVNDGDPNNPKILFDRSFVFNGTWASGTTADLQIKLIITTYELDLHIQNAVITMELAGTGAAASATNGMIAGVIETEELVESIRDLVGAIDPALCDPSFFENVAQRVRVSSDIMLDGRNGDPTQTCNAVSIGLGFTALPVTLGPIGTLPAEVDPCAPAGG